MAKKKERPTATSAAPRVDRRHAYAALLIVAAVLAAYANSFGGALVFDNRIIIENDPRIRAVTSDNLGQIWSKGYWFDSSDPTLYRPLATLSYLFNYAVLGNQTRSDGYHVVNLMLHAINALLVYALGLRLFGKSPPSLALACLWAVHPVITESVTNLVGRADELSGMGVLAGLLCYAEATALPGGRRIAWLTGLAAAASLAIFSKESGIVLIALMMVYDVTLRRRNLRDLIPGYAAAIVPVVVFLARRAQVLSLQPVRLPPFLSNPLVGAGFVSAKMTAIQVIGRYLLLIVWPYRLSCDYSYNQIPVFSGRFNNGGDWGSVLALLVCIGLALAAVTLYRRKHPGFFCIALFFVGLGPVANLAMPIGTIMAERLLYIPAIGAVGLIVLAVYAAERRGVQPLWVFGLLGLLLCVRTWSRNSDWETERSLFTSAVEAAPDSYRTHMNLATSLSRGGIEIDRAVFEAEQAERIVHPLPPKLNDDSIVYSTLGAVYRQKGDLAERASPGTGTEWYWRALAALQHGIVVENSREDAVQRANLAKGRPRVVFGSYDLYREIGRVYLRLHMPRQAVGAAARGSLLRADPDFFQTMFEGNTAMGDSREAAIALMEGLVIEPEHQEFLSQLVQFYRGLPSPGCALEVSGGTAGLNLACPMVREQLCVASDRVGHLFRNRGQAADADRVRSIATSSFGCPAQ